MEVLSVFLPPCFRPCWLWDSSGYPEGVLGGHCQGIGWFGGILEMGAWRDKHPRVHMTSQQLLGQVAGVFKTSKITWDLDKTKLEGLFTPCSCSSCPMACDSYLPLFSPPACSPPFPALGFPECLPMTGSVRSPWLHQETQLSAPRTPVPTPIFGFTHCVRTLLECQIVYLDRAT